MFFRVLCDNIDEIQPLVYTPTVGLACQKFGDIFQRPRGLFISANDRGRIGELLGNWPHPAKLIVVSDGERILGLGDLGANGMGIPVGKLSLYTACAGVHPKFCLPVMLDVGTNNTELLNDPYYVGVRRSRLRDAEYDEFVDEFVSAACETFPGVLIQFEDFANHAAFRLLRKYRGRVCVFNDDIQGTAAVALAGIFSALRVTGSTLAEQTLLFLGAGEAATGIADLVVSAMVAEGCAEHEARRRNWLVDLRGLVVKSRSDLAEHKLPYAHEHAPIGDFLSAIRTLKPNAIIGVAAVGGTFTSEVLHAMADLNPRPIVFALSNPTSKAECTAEEAYGYTNGRALFACGSPFDPVKLGGRTFVPRQGNNSYIFPGVGLGAIVSGARLITDEMFMRSARTLAGLVSELDLEQGSLYPAYHESARSRLRSRLQWQRSLTNEALRVERCQLTFSPTLNPKCTSPLIAGTCKLAACGCVGNSPRPGALPPSSADSDSHFFILPWASNCFRYAHRSYVECLALVADT